MAKQMAEDEYVATRAGRYRTSRYPGFTGGRTSTETGNIIIPSPASDPQAVLGKPPAPATVTPKSPLANIRSAGIDIPQTPDLVAETGKMAAQGLGTYAGSEIGREAGQALGAGAGAGEAISGAVDTLGDKVSGFFGGGGGEGEALSAGAKSLEATGVEGFAGAGLGAGAGRAVLGLLTGESPGRALKAGAATGVGTAIGTAVGGPVGGFIGGTIGSVVGGRVICTELVRQGRMDLDLMLIDLEHAERFISPETKRGYHWWAIHVVHLMRQQTFWGRLAVSISERLATWRALEISYVMEEAAKPHWRGRLVRLIGESACWLIGQFVPEQDWESLYADETT